MSTLIGSGVGVDEGAGASGRDADDSDFVCEVTEGGAGGPWKSLRMSTLIGFGVGVGGGAGALGLGAGGSDFVCGVTEGGAGGPWKSLRMSTLIGFGVGVDEGAGALGLDADDSDLDIKGATGPVAVEEIIVGVAGFEVEFDCSKDDGPAC